jgi:hypothetical protein
MVGLLRTGIGVFLVALLGIPAGRAQGKTFIVNPGQSEVMFSLADVLHQVHGTFQLQSGKVQFEGSRSQMSGSIVVGAGSGKGGNDTRDHRMSVDILNAPQFNNEVDVEITLVGQLSTTTPQ